MRLLTLTLLVLLAACRTDSARATDPDSRAREEQGIIAGTLTVQADTSAKQLVLRNTTENVVGYLAIEKDIMTIALFPPCGDQCTQLVQAQAKTIKYTDIVGYTPGAREARILWWVYVAGSDGILRPDGGVQTVHVRLD